MKKCSYIDPFCQKAYSYTYPIVILRIIVILTSTNFYEKLKSNGVSIVRNITHPYWKGATLGSLAKYQNFAISLWLGSVRPILKYTQHAFEFFVCELMKKSGLASPLDCTQILIKCDIHIIVHVVNYNLFIFFQTCTYEKLSSTGSARNSWLSVLSELNYFRGGSTVPTPMVCQKIVGTDGENWEQYSIFTKN